MYPKIAYILLHFPYLTETFVAEEMDAVKRRGIDLQIVSLLEPGSGPIQSVSKALMPDCWYAPGLTSVRLWGVQFVVFLRAPALYIRLLWTLLAQPHQGRPFGSLAKRVVIFLKAVATAEHLRGQGIELLHTHFAWLSGAATWVTARLLGLPFTVTTHAYDIYAKSELLDLVVTQADHVFTISEYNRNVIEEKCNCTPGHVSVLRCGIRYDKMKTGAQVDRARADSSSIRIMSVGSLNDKKGHDYLIEACALLAKRELSLTCSIFGDGRRYDELQSKIVDLGIEKQVHLLGPKPQEEIVDAFHQHDIFVLAAVVAANGDRDGIPVVLMEAGAFGLPLISTNVSGIPELVQHERTGLIVPERDPSALADAIQRLATDPALRRRLGERASALVHEEYEIDHNAESFTRSIESVLADRTSAALNEAVSSA